ncbi:hypothetical protein SAMN05446037_1008150 [Anaerovirgula multivorans]|uniref:Uncharacterized protein n=1 Tax=Anaerovirgula multivorans TaxID=312168 RepID=A0A239DWX2_9FIRM|nr:hypothetical protein [Anaerovirgula multivorans]SNS36193.1 hypothetical protein SAMN05446037_1008150 [Anaerovirgula multivorans]
MKIIAILIVFLIIGVIDFPKLSKQDKKKKYIIIYFTLLSLGLFISILQILVEDLPGPMLMLKNIIEKK